MMYPAPLGGGRSATPRWFMPRRTGSEGPCIVSTQLLMTLPQFRRDKGIFKRSVVTAASADQGLESQSVAFLSSLAKENDTDEFHSQKDDCFDVKLICNEFAEPNCCRVLSVELQVCPVYFVSVVT